MIILILQVLQMFQTNQNIYQIYITGNLTITATFGFYSQDQRWYNIEPPVPWMKISILPLYATNEIHSYDWEKAWNSQSKIGSKLVV